MILTKYNRYKKRKAKLGKSWCFACDRSLVGAGQKCKICGNLQQRRNKK